MTEQVYGVLLLYHYPARLNAPTIKDSIEAFTRYSSYHIYSVNTYIGFPLILEKLKFSAIILHYSLFGATPFKLNSRLINFIKRDPKMIKVVFFQDEYANCKERFQLINDLKIDTIFSLLEPQYFKKVYIDNTCVTDIRQVLAGYVSDALLSYAESSSMKFLDRPVEVGYRGRKLKLHLGEGAKEKSNIAFQFKDFAKDKKINVDISIEEKDRIYGKKWYDFVQNCKFMLGVQSGTSIFDLDGAIEKKIGDYVSKDEPSANDSLEKILNPFEKNINYRMISPRIFECAALKTCMILYSDSYQNILEADKHYIPLDKDFSNIDKVYKKMKNEKYVSTIIENAYTDIALAKKYHYSTLVEKFDGCIAKKGVVKRLSKKNNIIEKGLKKVSLIDKIKYLIIATKDASYGIPGRESLKRIIILFGYRPRN